MLSIGDGVRINYVSLIFNWMSRANGCMGGERWKLTQAMQNLK